MYIYIYFSFWWNNIIIISNKISFKIKPLNLVRYTIGFLCTFWLYLLLLSDFEFNELKFNFKFDHLMIRCYTWTKNGSYSYENGWISPVYAEDSLYYKAN